MPTVARQSMWTRRISPEGMRSVAQSPSLAISVTLVPAERPICAPRPSLSSTAWISVPTGMKRSGSAVARLDVGGVRRDRPSSPTPRRSRREDVRLLAVRVLEQRDARRAVRVVLDRRRPSAGTPVFLRLKSIDAVALLVATAAEPRRDAAVVVAAGRSRSCARAGSSRARDFVISPKSCVDMPRRPGEVGLYFLIAMLRLPRRTRCCRRP